MKKSIITVATCQRKDVEYLPQTLADLDGSGAKEADVRVVISDGAVTSNSPISWNVLMLPGQASKGCLRTLWAAFRRARLDENVERLIYFEDDVLPCKNAVSYALTMKIPPDVAFVDLCDFQAFRKGRGDRTDGIHRVPVMGRVGEGYWGTQAMMFPRRTFEWLARIDHVDYENLEPRSSRNPKPCDLMLSKCLSKSPWQEYGAHLPCLFQHVGATSAIYDGIELGPNRLATVFDPEFDALTLKR